MILIDLHAALPATATTAVVQKLLKLRAASAQAAYIFRTVVRARSKYRRRAYVVLTFFSCHPGAHDVLSQPYGHVVSVFVTK